MNKIESLYIHIPFCSKICTYCDFYKMVAKPYVKEKYVEYLIKELEMKKQYLTSLKTIFIGGGTPTCLSLESMEKLFSYLNQYIDKDILIEFTIEANPNDITLDMAKLFKKYNINRVSLGVQGLKEEKLKILGRTHNEEDVKKAIKNLIKAKITNINADIIYGVGKETFADIKYDLERLIKFGVKHISAYSLILEDKTVLKKLFDEKKFFLYDEDEESNLYKQIVNFLKKKKFIHYEISNFSKKDQQSNHNLVYWNNMNYIGAGASASYYIDNMRYTNIRNLEKYYQGIDNNQLNYAAVTELTKEDMMSEEMIMGLRKIEGINILDFKAKYLLAIEEAFPIIKKFISLELLEIKNNYLFIPEEKLYLSNEVLVNFV
ncbi:MAG: radical SAM family heme chaperone HemW [Bacilli bacterium]